MACWRADRGKFGEFWVWVGLGERWDILQWDRGRSFGADKVWDMWGFTLYRAWSPSWAMVRCMSDKLARFEMEFRLATLQGLKLETLPQFVLMDYFSTYYIQYLVIQG